MHHSLWKNHIYIWIGAILLSISLHFGIAAEYYDSFSQNDNYASPPSAIMISFSLEAEQPDIIDDSTEIVAATPIAPPPEDQEKIEEKQPDAPLLTKPIANDINEPNEKKPEPLKNEVKKQENKKVTPKKENTNQTQNKQQKNAIRQITTNTKQQYAGKYNNLTAEANGVSSKLWVGKLQTHLERQKNYLSKQRSNKNKGTVRLQITVSANGTIQTTQLISSSGSTELDQLAFEVLKRSSPLPKPPLENIGREVSIPLVFR